jgi:hypothetical protein
MRVFPLAAFIKVCILVSVLVMVARGKRKREGGREGERERGREETSSSFIPKPNQSLPALDHRVGGKWVRIYCQNLHPVNHRMRTYDWWKKSGG